jgi:cephalosporin-C deacetylase-like acetyl esterase
MMRYLRFWLAGVFLWIAGGCTQAQETTAPTEELRMTQDTVSASDPWQQKLALYNYDATQPLNIEQVRTEDQLVARVSQITYRGARGATVPAYWIVPQSATATDKVPGIVLIHGYRSSIVEMVPIALILAARGYGVIVPEIVGHGQRAKGLAPLFNGEAERLRDGLIESIQDIRRSMDVLATRPEVDAPRIGLVGLSLGAMLGTVTTAVDGRVKTAVLIVGGGDWNLILQVSQESAANARRGMGTVSSEDMAKLADVDPKNFAAKISPRPILMLNGRKDTIIPLASAKALFEAAREPKKQVWFESGHFLPFSETAVPGLDWLQEHLKVPVSAPVSASLKSS